MARLPTFQCFAVFLVLAFAPSCLGATVTGTVSDASGNPIQNARIDHTGTMVVIVRSDVPVPPAAGEIRTDAKGHFSVVTNVPAVVVRKPGYQSQRLRIIGDIEVNITLQKLGSTSRCKMPVPPSYRTREANDADYKASWYYIKTKHGKQGIISGSGSAYSLGAPNDGVVWNSDVYEEVMYESGMVDASGHFADGKYWRLRGIFGASAEYYGQTQEVADQLDCVMDHVPIKLGL